MPHLNEFTRNKLSYKEESRRFCLREDENNHIKAYNIDISGKPQPEHYFAMVYKKSKKQGLESADGIYVGSFTAEKNKKVNFVLVIELEGSSTSFDAALNQVKATLEHFCKETTDDDLADDGMKHHEQALNNKKAYGFDTKHIVAGLVIGSSARQGIYKTYKRWPIVCINSRQPKQDKTARELFLELTKYTGSPFW